MRKVLLLQAVFAAPIISLTLMAVVVGKALPPAAPSIGFTESCAAPCWNGINPGQTRLSDAIATLTALGYQRQEIPAEGGASLPLDLIYQAQFPAPVCEVGLGLPRQMSALVTELTLRVCEQSSLGHLVDALGPPQVVLPIASLFSYNDGQIVIVLRSRMCETPPTPHSPILFINLTQSQTLPANTTLATELLLERNTPSNNLPWSGFMPVWRYSQLFPGRAVC